MAHEQAAAANGVAYADVVAAEQQLILQAYEKLKSRSDGELRVSTRRNRETGFVEIIYLGVHEKEDLTTVRRLYERLARRKVSF